MYARRGGDGKGGGDCVDIIGVGATGLSGSHNRQIRSICPPPPVSNEQFCPQKIRPEQECSLDMPFGARDNIAKRRQYIPRSKPKVMPASN